MATEINYKFYQVSNALSNGVLKAVYQGAGNIVFDKTSRTLTICKDSNAANNTVYGGGLKTASWSNGKLIISDWDGASIEVDLNNYVTQDELTTELSKYYTRAVLDPILDAKANRATTLGGYGITDAFTKDETISEISNRIEAFGDILTLRGSVGSYDTLPTEGLQKGDVYQVTQAGTIPVVYLDQNGVLTNIVAIPAKDFEANAELYWVPRAEGYANTGSSMVQGVIPAHWDILGMSLVDTSDFVTSGTVNALENRVAVVEELVGASSGGSGESLAEKLTALEEAVDDNTKNIASNAAALCWAQLD